MLLHTDPDRTGTLLEQAQKDATDRNEALETIARRHQEQPS